MTIVSLSEITQFQTCLRAYYYKYGLGLSPIDERGSIVAGVDGHYMLETFFKALQRGLSKEDALREVSNNVRRKVTPDMLKTWTLVHNYLEKFEPNGRGAFVERVFIQDLEPEYDLKVGYTPDLVWEYPDGWLEVEDNKFVGRAWSAKKLDRYDQLNIYLMLLREAGYKVSRAVLRFFNTTTFKINHKVYNPSTRELVELRKDFVRAAIEVKQFKELPVAAQEKLATRTFNHYTCSTCDFVFPCMLERQGKDASKTFATQYTETTYGYQE